MTGVMCECLAPGSPGVNLAGTASNRIADYLENDTATMPPDSISSGSQW